MARKYDTAAPLAGKDISLRGEGIKLHIPDDLKPPPEAQRVSHSDGKSADAATVIVILVFDILVGLVVFAGFHWLGDVDAGVAFVIALFVLFTATVVTVAFLSGQLPALYEVFADMLVNRKRVAAVRDISLAQVAVYDKLAEAQLTDAQARLLESQNEEAAIKHAMLVDHTQRVMNQLQGYKKEPSTYTPADPMPDPSYMVVLRFIEEKLFTNVDPQTGRIKVAVPWGKTGDLSPTEAKRVVDWIDTVNKKAAKGPVFEYRSQAWHLNLKAYPSAWLVTQELRRTPLMKP